jgi:hypothetical protein
MTNGQSRTALGSPSISERAVTVQPSPARKLTLDDLRGRTVVSVPEGGAVLDLPRSGAYEAAKRGDLPTIRIGRRLVVPVPALLRMLGVVDSDSAV